MAEDLRTLLREGVQQFDNDFIVAIIEGSSDSEPQFTELLENITAPMQAFVRTTHAVFNCVIVLSTYGNQTRPLYGTKFERIQ